MATTTIARSDVTAEEVAVALRQRLGPRYHVLPGAGINAIPVSRPGSDQPDTILIVTGSDRMFRAEVAISGHSRQTDLDVRPGGLPGTQQALDRPRGAPGPPGCTRPLVTGSLLIRRFSLGDGHSSATAGS